MTTPTPGGDGGSGQWNSLELPDSGGQSTGSGTLDFNSILTNAMSTYGSSGTAAGGTSAVPVDSSGAVDIWNLPKYLLGNNAPSIWFDTGHQPSSATAELGMGEGKPVRLDEPSSFDINATPVEVMKQFAALSQSDPTQFRALQYQLFQGGFMGDATKVLGGFSSQTENALSNAIQQYLKVNQGAGVAVSFTQFLQNSVASNAANGNSGLPGQSGSSSITPAVRLTDPTTLTTYVQKAAQAALGRNLSTDEVSKFVSSFQDQQAQAEQTARAGNGGSYALPNPATDALDFVANQNKGEYAQHEVQGYADTLLSMLGIRGAPKQAPNPIAGVTS